MGQNATVTKRVPSTILPTIEKIKKIHGCKTELEAFEILCNFFNKHNSDENSGIKAIFEKIDFHINKIQKLLKLRIELKHICNILSDDININVTVNILKKYLRSRKIYF